jgi:hypothetical protein
MNSSKPPVVATWLFEKFLSSSANFLSDSALIGDLVERYQKGRSRTWYWKQVVVAIWTGCSRDIRAHKLLTFRALALGFLIVYLENWVWHSVFRLWSPLEPKWPVAFQMIPFPGVVVLLCWIVLFAFPGWAIARFHRPQAMTLVLLFTSLMEVPRVMFILDSYRLLLDSLSHSRFVPYLAGSLVQWLLAPICTVAAGLWAAHDSERGRSPETPEVIA